MFGRYLFIALAAMLVSEAFAAKHLKKVDSCTAPIAKYEKIQCEAVNNAIKSEEKVCKEMAASTQTQAAKDLGGKAMDPGASDEARNGGRFITNLLNSECSNSGDDTTNYATALATLAAPAILFLVLNYLCCCCCTCCHTCCKICTTNCCKCFKCIPSSEKGYGKMQKIVPVAVWSLLAMLVFIFAAVGIASGTHELNDSLVGGICQIDNTYLRFTDFLKNVKVPMKQLDEDFAKAVVDLESASKQNKTLSAMVKPGIPDKFDEIVTAATAASTQAKVGYAGSTAVEKETCDTAWDKINEKIKTARDESEDAANKLNDALIDAQEQIDTSIVGMAEPASNAIADGEKAIDDLKTQLDDMMNPRKMGGQNLIAVAQSIRDQRNSMAFGAFGYAFISVFFGVLAIVGMKMCTEEKYIEEGPRSNRNLTEEVIQLNCMGRCFSRFGFCSWWLILFFGIFSALFAIIWLPFAAAGRDMCQVLPGLPRDLGKWTGQEMVVSITDTCWNSTGNLFEGLNLDESIDVDSINFDDFDNAFADVKIPTDGLDTLKTAVADLTTTCKSTADTEIVALNAAIDAAKSQCQETEHGFATATTVADIKRSAGALVKTIKVAITAFIGATGCFFIACTWQETVGVICDGMVGSLGALGTAQMFIAVLSIPFAFAFMYIMKVMGGHGPVKNDTAAADGVEMGGVSPSKADKYAVDAPEAEVDAYE